MNTEGIVKGRESNPVDITSPASLLVHYTLSHQCLIIRMHLNIPPLTVSVSEALYLSEKRTSSSAGSPMSQGISKGFKLAINRAWYLC